LDQPFARLAPGASQALLAQLAERRGSGTTLVAADHPGLLQIADRIVVLKDGAALFSGTPAELLAAQAAAGAT